MLRTRSLPSTLIAPPRSGSSSTKRVQRMAKLPEATRILGIDPGLHRTGYGIIESKNGKLTLIEGGILRAKGDDVFPKRLQDLHVGLSEVINDHQPEVVVIEDLFSTYAHPKSALLMAHARGVLMLAAQEAGIAVHSFMPNEVKQVVTGNGHATKTGVQAAVKARLNLKTTLHPPDLADALAIAICFSLRQGMSQKLG
jgi:crossover junction endodeoxyribonuclease RuvC